MKLLDNAFIIAGLAMLVTVVLAMAHR